MLLRGIVDLVCVLAFVLVYQRSPRIFTNDRDTFIALPLLGALIIAIFVASNLQDLVFGFKRAHDWPLYITSYSVLGAAHLIVLSFVLFDALRYLRERGLQRVNAQ
jgi:hypothetical protein